ncbi:DUF7311 family protein [Halobellus limi]|uniref:DUF7311 domain-containing protein n=1 Tax=Halobellus limi TaxID=699433 RepID=A0A1H5YYJ6_9EURY|nr:hypothetical protein [Halobellus limi]QCC48286.1 hypothetical protein DV707_11780 [Halobellus limi]SEG29131.1 hypothetical protein SAMN04488133_1777 [Halobellus limi]
MIRLVVAAVLTVATLSAALPAVDDARATRTDADLAGSIDRIERAGRSLATSEDATPTRAYAATRRVAFRTPDASLTTARPAFVAVGGRPGGPGNRSVVAYAVGTSPTRLRGVSLPIPVSTPDGPVVFTAPGRHAVDVALVRDGGRPTLVVTRG